MTRIVTFAASLALLACAAPEVAPSTEAIVGGTYDTGHPEVVFLYRQDGAACTGSIIAPRVVLTANHCVAGGSGVAAPPYYFRVFVGSAINRLTAEYRVSEVRQVPGAGFGRGTANDVALLVLSTAATETPRGLGRAEPWTLPGSTVTAVGFGQTPSGQSGTKYWVATRVNGYDGGFIFVPPSVCSGDSGGPMIGEDGLVYGVASFIFSPDGRTEPRCGTAPGAYNEIFRHLAFIDSVLEETGTCVPDGAEECNGNDDDCDNAVDEGCTPLGDPCTDGATCVGGLCADTPAGRICTSTCDPLRPAVGCGADFYCAMSGGCQGHCVRGARGEAPNGTDCSANTDCASLFCTDPGDGRRRCLDPCRGDAGLCLAGEACPALPGACSGCVPAEIVSAARGLGEPCERDANCRTGMVCYRGAGVAECASACVGGECPEGFECRESACVRDRRQGVGGVCVDNADCGAAVCAAQGMRRWCTAECADASACPSGFDCVEAGGTRVCAPARSLLGEPCNVNDDCVTGLCATLPDGRSVCTSFCDVRNACAPGFECRRAGDGAVCVPPAEPPPRGGCSASASSSGGAAAFVLALVALVARRRSRR